MITFRKADSLGTYAVLLDGEVIGECTTLIKGSHAAWYAYDLDGKNVAKTSQRKRAGEMLADVHKRRVRVATAESEGT